MTASRTQGRARAFTLIELLVVIGVIAILAGIAIPALSGVRTRSQVQATEALLQRLKLAIESYSDAFGDYPPSTFRGAGLRGSNGENDGAEVLVRCLTSQAKGGPFVELRDEELCNTDGDALTSDANPTRSTFATRDLLEPADVWGNPLAYIHNAEYDRGATARLVLGGTAPVSAARSEKTQQLVGLNSFQLWSAGPDGVAGTEDDIRVWGE